VGPGLSFRTIVDQQADTVTTLDATVTERCSHAHRTPAMFGVGQELVVPDRSRPSAVAFRLFEDEIGQGPATGRFHDSQFRIIFAFCASVL
jgi:hypothetical protein